VNARYCEMECVIFPLNLHLFVIVYTEAA
jgi:hypothetical protein